MKVVFLGTASAIPTPRRNLSATIIQRGGELLLFDAGEGVQRAIMKSNLGFNKKMKIFITHMHGDHVSGLTGILQTMSMMQRTNPVYLYGPPGLVGYLRCTLKYVGLAATFQVSVKTVGEGVVVKEPEYQVRAFPARHSIRAYSYLLEEFPRPGVFYPERARKLGIPEGPLWSKLQHGDTVRFKNKVFHPRQVSSAKRKGRKVGISGDTRPTKSLIKFFKDADLVIFDSTYSDEHSNLAEMNLHSTAREAASLAQEAGARKLVLTHFSSRYEDVSNLLSQAREAHPDVVAADDLMTINVPYL